MGNQCCGNPGEDNHLNEVNASNNGKVAIRQTHDNFDGLNPLNDDIAYRSGIKVEPIDENEVEYKYDYQVGEGASYTG